MCPPFRPRSERQWGISGSWGKRLDPHDLARGGMHPPLPAPRLVRRVHAHSPVQVSEQPPPGDQAGPVPPAPRRPRGPGPGPARAARLAGPVRGADRRARRPVPGLSPGPDAPRRNPAAALVPPSPPPSRPRLLMSPNSPPPIPSPFRISTWVHARRPSWLHHPDLADAPSAPPAPAGAPLSLPPPGISRTRPPRGGLPPAPLPAIESP